MLVILATQEAEIRMILVQGQPRQKSSQEPHVHQKKKSSARWHVCHAVDIPATQEAKLGGLCSDPAQAQTRDSLKLFEK
jgi:hypothetical protein